MSTTHDYLNFDLLITRAGDGYRAYVIDAPGGDADTTFSLPFVPDEIGRLVHSNGTRRGVRAARTPSAPPADLRDMGSRLFDAVFRDEVRNVLVASQSSADREDTALRIRLRFAEDATELATLPWEILFDGEQQHFLALSEARPILRYLSLPRPRPPLVVKPPLAVLAVLASPTDHPPLNVEQEWQAVQTALDPLCADGKVILERLERPTLDTLRERLLGEPVHVLHFVGHGLFDPDQRLGLLLFEDNRGQGHAVPASSLALLLHNHSSLRLVYLNACEGAIADEGNVFAGVAQTLVQGGVPAAVAMQAEITDTAAIELTRTFYTALATGRPVDAALSQARVALAAQENDEWAIPVLFSRSPDNHLFDMVDMLPTPDCPYPGLRPFTEEQADRFFGRDREIEDGVARLRQHPFLTVIGPSGSGKSSLVCAGLLPALKRSRYFGDGDLTVKTMRPGDAPMQALMNLLDLPDASSISQSLNHSISDSPILLFIDQFEETFTLADEAEAAQFLAAFPALIDTPNLYILLTVRADFYPELMAMGPLWEAVKTNRLELTPLGDDELWAAIVQPAAGVGVTVDEALAVALIADASGEAGVLPLVQETLVLLWEKVERRQLKLSAYTDMAEGDRSGIAVAIDRRASVVYNNLPAAAQPIARRIFLRLVQFGAGRADTRRQQTVAELRASGDDPALFDQTLRTLTDSRLLTTSGSLDEDGGERRVDISHEALIGGWGLLQRWIGEKREAESTRRRLEEKVAEWERLERSGGLLDEYELREAEMWLQQAEAEELGVSEELLALVAASRSAIQERKAAEEAARQRELEQQRKLAEEQRLRAEEQEDAADRLRRRLMLLAGAVGIAMLALAAATWFGVSANQQREHAEIEAVNARARELAFHVQAVLENPESDPSASLALLLATEAVSVTLAQNGTVVPEARRALVKAIDAAPGFVKRFDVHSARVRSVAFHPDGQRLVTASDDGTAQIIRLDNSASPTMLDNDPSGDVLSAVFSPDGTRVVTTRDDGTARLWSTSGEQLRLLSGHQGRVNAATFTANGAYIVTVGEDGLICVWEAATGVQVISFPGSQGAIWDVAAHPDQARNVIVTAGNDGTVKVWAIPDTVPIYETHQHAGAVRAVSFSQQGDLLFSGGDDFWAYMYAYPDNLKTDRTYDYLGRWKHSDHVSDLAVSPDGIYLATVGPARKVNIFSIERQRMTLLHEYAGHTTAINSVAFDPTGRTIATAGADHSVRVWSTTPPSPLLFEGHKSFVISAAFRPDSRQIATRDADDKIIIWDMDQKIAPRMITVPEGASTVSYSSDGRWLLDGFTLYDATSITEECGFSGDIYSAFSPTDHLIATAGRDELVQLWDYHCQHIDSFSAESITWLVDFSPDGEQIITAGADGVARIWDRKTGDKIREIRGHGNHAIFSALFDSSGTRIVTAGDDWTARIWDARDGRQKCVLRGHIDRVWHAEFSPDGKRVITASDDGTAKIWDAESCQVVTTLSNHTSWVRYAAYSPNGKWIVTTSGDQTARIWNAETFKEEFVLTDHEIDERPIDDLMDLARSLIQRRSPTFTEQEKARYLLDGS